jgi:hypothetical protein
VVGAEVGEDVGVEGRGEQEREEEFAHGNLRVRRSIA